MRFISAVCMLFICLVSGSTMAQSITSVTPRSVRPGVATELTVVGKGFDSTLRFLTRCNSQITIDSVEPEKAVIQFTVPSDAPLGSIGLWAATKAGPVPPVILLIDDLNVVSDSGKNHSFDTAQEIPPAIAIDGKSDGASLDYYRMHVNQNQWITIEALTQCLASAMDPAIRLLDAQGKPILLADDDGVGSECRFRHQFTSAGDYVVEIKDSGYASGGSYHLRIGDFPLVSHCFPLAVTQGQEASVDVSTFGKQVSKQREVTVQNTVLDDDGNLAFRFKDGQASAWQSIHVSAAPQHTEGSGKSPLAYPVGINGRLLAAGEQDEYTIQGIKNETVRFRSKTRSLGSTALLNMQLVNDRDQVVAESKVTDADEWSFDFKFPADGLFRLRTSDLLGRGGEGFGYLVEVIPSGRVELSLKPDAKTKEEFVIEFKHGACALDLQVGRFGYDGEVELAFSRPVEGLRILNPRVPAKAKTVKIYLLADENWKPSSSSLVELRGAVPGKVPVEVSVSSLSLHRVKRPHVPFPGGWRDGTVLLSGTVAGDAYYSLELEKVLQLARQQSSHQATLLLKRSNDKFKSGVVLLTDESKRQWGVAAKAEKDKYTLTLTRSNPAEEPSAVSLLAYSDFNGRGRMTETEYPVQWIDPVTLSVSASQSLVAGKTHAISLQVNRKGSDPQPVEVAFKSLPKGWTAGESVTVAADQNNAVFNLTLPADSTDDTGVIHVEVVSQYQGQPLKFGQDLNALPIASMPESIAVHPNEIEMAGKASRRQLVVTGYDAQKVPQDWTREAVFRCLDEAVAEVRNGVVHAKADGVTELVVQVGMQQINVPIRVSAATKHRNIAFESEVLVALSKQGCNSGACHGSPSGKGMFRLSLRGFDQKLDLLTLIREDFGRRVNRIEPEQSLLLQKPLMKVSHGGGKQIHPDDPAYRILRDWIAEGAQADPPEASRCVRLEVFPAQKRIMSLEQGKQQLSVLAHFADGSTRDVTDLVVYESSDQTVAAVDESGWIEAGSQGEAVILVRFLEHIESVPFMFVQRKPDFQWASPPATNYIDELVNAKLKQIQYLPSATCSDSEFLRRVYLDVIGVLPTVQESKEFLADASTDKRAALVDRLLERDEYSKFWALKWGDLLKMTSQLVGKEGVYKYHRWVEEAFRQNMPYDQFARELLSAEGSTLANPPANFYRTATSMNDCVETVSQVFLGARLQCAKCHNHPFERWTQDNYYGLGAFFQRVQRRKTQRPGEMFVWSASTGEVTQPRTGQQMKPWLPVTGTVDDLADGDRRDTFVDWLVNVENPYFARIEANRIWSECFSRGIVEPIDDFRDSNPPSNGPLLDALASDFAEHGFDRKHLLRIILNSRTYQASYLANDSNREDQVYFSHQLPRLMSAEQLLDAINHATGLQEKFANLPVGTKATHLPAPDLVKLDFLKVFGQPERSTVCACERTSDSNLGMAIELFNGPTIHKKLQQEANRFRTALKNSKSLTEILDQLYLAAVCRLPTDFERKAALEHCGKRETPAEGLADVCWALLNTDEFIFQH
jgi:hypothetical protein